MSRDDVLSKKRKALLSLTEEDTKDESASTEKLRELLDRAGPMIDQLNNLYNQYIAGALQTPPLERRNQLDSIISTVTVMAKPTKALRFKFNTIQGKYIIYRDRWDKRMKDLESGKIKRIAGPSVKKSYRS